MSICFQCGAAVEPGAGFCGSCGAATGPSAPRPASSEGACARHAERPAVGTCVRCGTFFCGECMPERERGVRRCHECQAVASRLPWDDRDSLGIMRAWWQTSVKMIVSPLESLRAAEPSAPLGSSLLFAAISSVVGFLTTIVLYALFIVGMLGFAARESGGDNPLGKVGVAGGLGIGIGAALLYILLAVGFSLLGVLFYAGLEHLTLRLLGGPMGSYAVSVRAQALGMGPYLVGLLPVCSLYVFPIWSIVIRIFAMQHLHRTTGGKAVAAVLLPFGLLCACGVSLYLAMFAAMIAAGK